MRLPSSSCEPTRRFFFAASGAVLASLGSGSALAQQVVRIDNPPPGKAAIVFYRRSIYAGGAISYMVREGKTDIGVLESGGYFVALVDPGWHTYTVHAERHSDMQIQVEDGEIYYVRFELDLGVVLYQPTLTPAQQWQFDQASPRLHRTEPAPPPAQPAPAP